MRLLKIMNQYVRLDLNEKRCVYESISDENNN